MHDKPEYDRQVSSHDRTVSVASQWSWTLGRLVVAMTSVFLTKSYQGIFQGSYTDNAYGMANFSRRLKQFDSLTWLTLNPLFYDRSTEPIARGEHAAICRFVRLRQLLPRSHVESLYDAGQRSGSWSTNPDIRRFTWRLSRHALSSIGPCRTAWVATTPGESLPLGQRCTDQKKFRSTYYTHSAIRSRHSASDNAKSDEVHGEVFLTRLTT